jgi:hypothetical protein
MDPQKIKAAMAAATEAAAEIEDPELKKIAFQTVLSHGLNEDAGKKVSGTRKTPRVPRKTSATVKMPKESNIRLTADQIRELRSFFDGRRPTSEDDTVFALAIFLTNTLHQEEFHKKDLLVLYQNLLSSRPEHRPAVLDLERIKRSVSWLVAPSRKKMWLEKHEGNYRISAQGLIHVGYESSNGDKPA